MAKISELPVAGELDGTEQVPIVKDGETRKATLADVVTPAVQPLVERAEAAVQTMSNAFGYVYPVSVGGRLLQPTVLSYDLYVIEGVWLDTLEPYSPLAPVIPDAADAITMADSYRMISPISVGGRLIQPTILSFDLYVISGVYLDTGELFGGGAASSAQDMSGRIWVEQTPTRIRLFRKGVGEKYICRQISYHDIPAKNCRVWHLDGAWEATRVSGAFVLGLAIINSGEVETAVRQALKNDFMGADDHGNELNSDAFLLIDGARRSLNATASYACERLELFQASNLHEVANGANSTVDFSTVGQVMVKMYKRWLFDASLPSRFALTQDFEPQVNFTTHEYGSVFLAMWPMYRLGPTGVQISKEAARAPRFAREDVSVPGFAEIETKTDEIMLWGDTGYGARVKIDEGWTQPGRRAWVRNVSTYNKLYFDFYGPNVPILAGANLRMGATFDLLTSN